MNNEYLHYLSDLEERYITIERERNQPDPDLWRWSPLHFGVFNHMLFVAEGKLGRYTDRIRFFEAGCGIGTKLALAKGYGMRETGWEIFDEYIAVARQLGVNVEKHDLRTDVPPYADFDIVYIARPFKDDGYERAWESAVMAAMRPGAILMASFLGVKPYPWECFFRRPWRGVWRKPEGEPADPSLAAALAGRVPEATRESSD